MTGVVVVVISCLLGVSLGYFDQFAGLVLVVVGGLAGLAVMWVET